MRFAGALHELSDKKSQVSSQCLFNSFQNWVYTEKVLIYSLYFRINLKLCDIFKARIESTFTGPVDSYLLFSNRHFANGAIGRSETGTVFIGLWIP